MSAALGFGFSALAFVASLLVTRWVRGFARRRELLDAPNHRSAHATPTPRLGGIGLMVGFLGAATGLSSLSGAEAPATWVVLGCTAGVAALGLLDDLRPLSARIRFPVQLALASTVVLAAGDHLPALAEPLEGLPRWLLQAGAVLWITWATNLYNFMDGIDGLAGGQALIAGVALGGTALLAGDPLLGWTLLLLAAAAAGFLVFNAPPASIFMGDVGSTAIGFFLAACPLSAPGARLPLLAVVFAISLFVLDATTTLVRRALRGERVYTAHRSHLYQRPLALGVPHRQVTYPALSMMLAVGLLLAPFARAGTSARLALFGVPLALYAGALVAVRRLERSALTDDHDPSSRGAPGRCRARPSRSAPR